MKQKVQSLDRFAGSSDEEDGGIFDENENRNYQKNTRKVKQKGKDSIPCQKKRKLKNVQNLMDDPDAEVKKQVDESSSSADDEYGQSIYLGGVTNDADDEQEENDDSDDFSENESKKIRKLKVSKIKTSRNSESEDEDGFMDPKLTKGEGRGQVGMADAMSRILGIGTTLDTAVGDNDIALTMNKASSSKDRSIVSKNYENSSNVVLSKIITPIQKKQRQEKSEEDILRNKQKQRRERNLIAMHVPLSLRTMISTKSGSSDSMKNCDVAKEIELEFANRKVATKGVVALFNAIAQHQRAQQQVASHPAIGINNTSTSQQLQSMTKHGFLEMIRNSSSTTTGNAVEAGVDNSNTASITDKTSVTVQEIVNKSKGSSTNGSKNAKKGWNALKDDFMMDSKLKDWDKQLSDEEDSWDECDNAKDADAFMDDD